ncbi:MAG TPA: ATP-binding protein [Candidatus Dormibacteraeota bacterium]|jgi:heavy metal sensor kinase|nr:ATP-binding protein [Candidatus Dormibacteraeota bacterium]
MNLDTIRRLLEKSDNKNPNKIEHDLEELSNLWANGALLEVADAQGNWIFRSSQFALASPPIPDLRGANVDFFTTNLDFSQYRIAMQRVKAGNEIFEIRAAVPTEPFDQALDHFRLIEKECLPLLVLLASLLGYWLSGRSLAPVNRIIETAELVGVQNLSRRLEVPKAKDELRRLTLTLNAMLDRIETSFKKITQFTADASHDLRTPVAVIRTSAELALRKERSEVEYRDALNKILATSVETSELLENLLSLARADAGALGLELHPLELGEHVRKVQERAVILSADKSLDFRLEAPTTPVWVKADAIALDRLLSILVDNAIKYTPSGGHCEIALSQEKDNAQITVSDSGIGITKEDIQHIFDRFYRADRARSRNRRGAGLGLAIARWITDMHGGKIMVESEPGAGSIFRVSLPIAQQS